jgi:hypothetical protein
LIAELPFSPYWGLVARLAQLGAATASLGAHAFPKAPSAIAPRPAAMRPNIARFFTWSSSLVARLTPITFGFQYARPSPPSCITRMMSKERKKMSPQRLAINEICDVNFDYGRRPTSEKTGPVFFALTGGQWPGNPSLWSIPAIKPSSPGVLSSRWSFESHFQLLAEFGEPPK